MDSNLFALAPSQHWFFEQEVVDRNHFNFAILVECRRRLETSLVETAVQSLIKRHDALRLRFVKTSTGWLQYAEAEPVGPCCVRFDLSGIEPSQLTSVISSCASRLHSGLSISQGPLIRVAIFDYGAERSQHLLVTLHHLAVDVMSCQILIRELSNDCETLLSGTAISEAPTRRSFRLWAESLAQYAQSGSLRTQIDYWTGKPWRDVVPLVDTRDLTTNSLASTQTVSFLLSEQETRAVMMCGRLCRAQPGIVILAAIEEAITNRVMGPTVITIEGHGREDLFDIPEVARTVGWFTAAYPFRLLPRTTLDAAAAIMSFRDRLHAVPTGGLGYGLLRYLSGDQEVSEELRSQPQPQISFNYAGFGPTPTHGDGPWFQALPDSPGHARNPRDPRPYVLDITATLDRRLRLDCAYSQNSHDRKDMEMLGRVCCESLRRLSLQCN